MKLEVPKEILKAECQCVHNRICQSVGGKPHCTITETVNGTVYFSATRHPGGCPHQSPFGSVFICTCPVRQEIHRKYRV